VEANLSSTRPKRRRENLVSHTLSLVDGWTATFNGDFSGHVLMLNHDTKVSADIPCDVFKAVVAEWVRLSRVRKMEGQTSDELLGIS
jgi:hypothetical protein